MMPEPTVSTVHPFTTLATTLAKKSILSVAHTTDTQDLAPFAIPDFLSLMELVFKKHSLFGLIPSITHKLPLKPVSLIIDQLEYVLSAFLGTICKRLSV